MMWTDDTDVDAEMTRKRPGYSVEGEPLFLPESSDEIIDLDDMIDAEEPGAAGDSADDDQDPSYGWYEKPEDNEGEEEPATSRGHHAVSWAALCDGYHLKLQQLSNRLDQPQPPSRQPWTLDEDGLVRWTNEAEQTAYQADQDASDDTAERAAGIFADDGYASRRYEDGDAEMSDKEMDPYEPGDCPQAKPSFRSPPQDERSEYEPDDRQPTPMEYHGDEADAARAPDQAESRRGRYAFPSREVQPAPPSLMHPPASRNEWSGYEPIRAENGAEDRDYEDEAERASAYDSDEYVHEQPGLDYVYKSQYDAEAMDYAVPGDEAAQQERQAAVLEHQTTSHYTNLAYGGDAADDGFEAEAPVWEDENYQAPLNEGPTSFGTKDDGELPGEYSEPRRWYSNQANRYTRDGEEATWAVDHHEHQPRSNREPSVIPPHHYSPAIPKEHHWDGERAGMEIQAEDANPSSDADFQAWLKRQGLADAWQMAALDTTAF